MCIRDRLCMDAPIRVTRFGLRRDSGGAGRHRGGLGVAKEYEFLADNIRLTYRGERHVTAARGSQGGGPGARSRAAIHRADGRVEEIASKTSTSVSRGDRLMVETAGGGGFGDPASRARERIDADIANGKVSRAGAASLYRASTD